MKDLIASLNHRLRTTGVELDHLANIVTKKKKLPFHIIAFSKKNDLTLCNINYMSPATPQKPLQSCPPPEHWPLTTELSFDIVFPSSISEPAAGTRWVHLFWLLWIQLFVMLYEFTYLLVLFSFFYCSMCCILKQREQKLF